MPCQLHRSNHVTVLVPVRYTLIKKYRPLPNHNITEPRKHHVYNTYWERYELLVIYYILLPDFTSPPSCYGICTDWDLALWWSDISIWSDQYSNNELWAVGNWCELTSHILSRPWFSFTVRGWVRDCTYPTPVVYCMGISWFAKFFFLICIYPQMYPCTLGITSW